MSRDSRIAPSWTEVDGPSESLGTSDGVTRKDHPGISNTRYSLVHLGKKPAKLFLPALSLHVDSKPVPQETSWEADKLVPGPIRLQKLTNKI